MECTQGGNYAAHNVKKVAKVRYHWYGYLRTLCIWLGFPTISSKLCQMYPEYTSQYHIWLVFLLITAIPCYGVLLFAWRIANNIGKGDAFTYSNGKAFRGIFWMAAADTLFFFGGNVLFLLCNFSRPAIFLISLVLVFFGIAIAVCAKAMSHLVDNAAALQEENNGTI